METLETYQIGAAAKAAGVHVQTLHYYERQGLIAEPERSAAGYREYSPASIGRIRAIKRAQSLGFTLKEIKELAALRDEGHAAGELRALVGGKIAEIDDKIALLRKMRRALQVTAETCGCGGDLSRCDVLAGLEGPI